MERRVSRLPPNPRYSQEMEQRTAFLDQAVAVLRRIIGVPDYDRYVAHMRERHPGESPMSRPEFERRCQDDRYNRPGSRCC